MERLNGSILVGRITPVAHDKKGEPLYFPTDVIRLAEEVDYGCWQIWKDLSQQKRNMLTATKVETVPLTRPSDNDWKAKARAIAQEIGLEKYSIGIRQISARSICDETAKRLAEDKTTHGL